MGFGSDFSGVEDLDANLTFLSGDQPEALALAQAVARRITTPRGGLFYRQSYGDDIRNYISDTANAGIVAQQVSAEIRKDERISACDTQITAVGETWMMVIGCTASTGATFTLTIAVSAVTVTLLAVDTP